VCESDNISLEILLITIYYNGLLDDFSIRLAFVQDTRRVDCW